MDISEKNPTFKTKRLGDTAPRLDSYLPKPDPDIEDLEASWWPADLAEEKGLLGCCLNGHAVPAVAVVTADLFSTTTNIEIWHAIASLVAAGATGDLEYSQLADALRRRGSLEHCGGLGYIESLDETVMRLRPLESRLRIIRDLATRRKLLRIWVELRNRAKDLREPVDGTESWFRREASR